MLAIVVVIAILFAVLVYRKVSRVSGQVTDVTSLVTNQTHVVDHVLLGQTRRVDELLSRVDLLAAEVEIVRIADRTQRALTLATNRTSERLLRRFQLLFSRLLRAVRVQLPAQTQSLVATIQRALARLRGVRR